MLNHINVCSDYELSAGIFACGIPPKTAAGVDKAAPLWYVETDIINFVSELISQGSDGMCCNMQEFTFTMDRSSKQPLYRQLYNYLVREIKSGNLQESEKLPGKKSLAAHLGVSQSTVETAYEMLAAEGYVVAKPRSGFYVNKLELLQPLGWELTPEPAAKQRNLPAKAEQSWRFSLLSGNIDTNVFPYGTWAKITKEVVYNRRDVLAYGEREGDYELRCSLTKYLHEFRGVNCSSEQVIIGAGLEYLLHLVCIMLGQETVFALEDPGYKKTAEIFCNNGARIEFLPVDEGGMSPTALRKSAANVAYITPSHQFPMGVVMPVGRRLKMLNWAYQRPERYIIEDDYDSEFRYNGSPIPALQGMDNNGRVIYVGTFSRSIAPALRVAYMVLPPDLLKANEDKFQAYGSTVSRMDQQILNEFLAGGHFARHLNKVRNAYRQRRDALVNALRSSPLANKISIVGDNAGLHFLLQVRCGKSEPQLVAAAAARGVRLTALSDCCHKSKFSEPTVMLGFADLLPEQASEAAAELAAAWLDA